MTSTLGLLFNTQTARARYLQVQGGRMLETLFSRSYRRHQRAAPFIVVVLLWYFWQKRRRSLAALQAAKEVQYTSQSQVKAFFQKYAVLAVFQR